MGPFQKIHLCILSIGSNLKWLQQPKRCWNLEAGTSSSTFTWVAWSRSLKTSSTAFTGHYSRPDGTRSNTLIWDASLTNYNLKHCSKNISSEYIFIIWKTQTFETDRELLSLRSILQILARSRNGSYKNQEAETELKKIIYLKWP